MVKNSFILAIRQEKEKTTDLLNFKYLVLRIRYRDSLHIWNYMKEIFLSQGGLRKILGKRQRLLDYLSKKNKVRYKKLIGQLGIRLHRSQVESHRSAPVVLEDLRMDNINSLCSPMDLHVACIDMHL